jgi:hypothetical protein
MVALNYYGINQTTTIYWPVYSNYNYPPASSTTPPPKPGRMKRPFQQNKGDAVLVPPVLLELCTREPWPMPLAVRLATLDWCARRLAARRRHLPLRSRPGARW